MLTKNLVNNNIPQLHLQDSVEKALQLINDFRISHLPVVVNNTFFGLISEDDLLDAANNKFLIEVLQHHFIHAAVLENVHFLNAVSCSIQFDTTVIPVLDNEGKYVGAISSSDLLKTLGNFSGANEIGGIIVLEMKRSQFAISEISRIVESNDSTILHLNSTEDSLTGMLTVTLHINKREIASVLATFERYDYTVVYSFGNEKFTNEIDSNYQNLMSYLDV
jgi:acetoin utilization protein AcuB